MRFHKRTAHASVNCQCCDKQFKTENLLRNHVKEKNFKETCSHCQTEFGNPRSYSSDQLFNQTEEVVEAAHAAKFDIFWRQYKVLDVESEILW